MQRRSSSTNSFFLRLLTVNMVIIIVLVVVVQLVNYRYFGDAYNKEIEKLNMQAVQQLSSSIEDKMVRTIVNTISQNSINLSNDEALVIPMEKNIRGDSIAKINVIKRLGKILSTIPVAASVDILYPQSGLFFSDTRIYDLQMGTDSLNYRKTWVESYTTSPFQVAWFKSFDQESGSNYITYARSIPYFVSPEQRKAVISVNIKENTLVELLNEMKLSEEGRLIVFDRNGQIIGSNRSEEAALSQTDQPWIQQLLKSANHTMFSFEKDGRTFIVSSVRSELSPWIYVSLVEKQMLYRSVYQLKMLLAFIIMAVLAIGGFAAILLLHRVQKPYRSMLREYTTRIQLLDEKVNLNKPIIRYNYIVHLLHGIKDRIPGVYSEWNVATLKDHYDSCFSFVLKIYRYEGTFTEELGEYYLVIDFLEALSNEELQVFAVMEEQGTIQGFVCYNHQWAMELLIRNITIIMDEISVKTYVFSFGTAYGLTPVNIAASYEEAIITREYSFIWDDSRILSYESLNLQELKETGTITKVLSEMEYCVRNGDKDKLMDIMNLIARQVGSRRYRIEYCKHLLSDAVSTLYKELQRKNLDITKMFGYDIRDFAKNIHSLNDFEQWIGLVIETSMNYMEDHKKHTDQGLEERIKQYIHANIRNQLTLGSVADHAGVSPNYLSKIFKAYTDTTFIDYITELKLDLSLQILKEKKKTVNEIAAELGYQSVNHFIRIFKQKYGQTPKQYQKWLSES